MRLGVRLLQASLLAMAVPAFAALTPKEALRLAKHPEVVMIDASTCEMRDAIYNMSTGKLSGPGHHLALFRHHRDKLPFAEGITSDDSTVTIHFEAKSGEVFYGRAFQVDKKEKKIMSAGPMYRHVCQPSGQVDVGDLEQVKKDEAPGEAGSVPLSDVESPQQ